MPPKRSAIVAQMIKALHRCRARPDAPCRRRHEGSRPGAPERRGLQTDLRPFVVDGAAADRPDRRQGIGAQFGEAAIAQRLDARRCLRGSPAGSAAARRGAASRRGAKCWIVDRKALARPRQGIVVEAGRLIGVDQRRQALDLLAGEMRHDGLAAGIGGAAGQPGIANAMAVDAVLRGKDRAAMREASGSVSCRAR